MTDYSALPARDLTQGDPRSITSLDGTVLLHVDMEEFDFHIDARPLHTHRALCDILTQAEWWGLEPLDEGEGDPIVLPGGGVRIYLVPIFRDRVSA